MSTCPAWIEPGHTKIEQHNGDEQITLFSQMSKAPGCARATSSGETAYELLVNRGQGTRLRNSAKLSHILVCVLMQHTKSERGGLSTQPCVQRTVRVYKQCTCASEATGSQTIAREPPGDSWLAMQADCQHPDVSRQAPSKEWEQEARQCTVVFTPCVYYVPRKGMIR